MYKLPTFYLLFLFTLSVFSQTLNFESVIVEKKTSRPVADATVSISKTDLSVKTNNKGVFVFKKEIPFGDHIISVSKEGFETTYFLINSEKNKQIIVEKIEIEITKKEAKRRKNIVREEAIKLKEAKKANKDREKLLAKKARKLKRRNTVDVAYYDTSKLEPKKTADPVPEPIVITETQIKYSKILDVPVEYLTNKELYNFIEEWMGVSYVYGGETKDGIDCSSFAQRLNSKAFNRYIERTAVKQYKSKSTDKFKQKTSLKEGDLVFFKGVGPDNGEKITHVGVYLHNNKFVHATSSSRTEGVNGVKISNLSDKYWSNKFVAGGRIINQ